MPSTDGFVGTIEVETRGVSRIWFGLTDNPTASDWVRIGNPRAWFTMNLETENRPYELAKLTLLLEAQRNELAIRVSHDAAITEFQKFEPLDSFEVDGVRILRQGLSL